MSIADCSVTSAFHPLTQEHHVLVMTPQMLLNMLDAGAAHFNQIALLVSTLWWWGCVWDGV